MTKPLVSIVIPTLNRPQCLDFLLKTIQNNTAEAREVIIVDSNKNSIFPLEVLDETVRVIKLPWTTGPAKACQIGACNAVADYIVWLNDDCIADRVGWLTAMLKDMVETGAALGAFMWSEPGRKPRFNTAFGKIVANFGCVRRDVFAAVGGFDHETFPDYGFDDDFSLRVHAAGYKVIGVEKATLRHTNHCDARRCRQTERQNEAMENLLARWGGVGKP